MSDDRPLDPHVAALLAAERTRPEADDDAADRIFSRLATSIAAMPPDGHGPDGLSGAGAGSTPPPVSGGGALSAKLAAIIVGAFTAGVGAGVLGHARLAEAPLVIQRAAPIVIVNTGAVRPADAFDVAASSAPTASPVRVAPPPPSVATPSTGSAHAGRPRSTERDVALARERAWIERARTAIARAAWSDALAALEGHASEFASGRMAEERDALTVHVLAGQGRMDEARARARAFEARYPSSVFLPIVMTDPAAAPKPSGQSTLAND